MLFYNFSLLNTKHISKMCFQRSCLHFVKCDVHMVILISFCCLFHLRLLFYFQLRFNQFHTSSLLRFNLMLLQYFGDVDLKLQFFHLITKFESIVTLLLFLESSFRNLLALGFLCNKVFSL